MRRHEAYLTRLDAALGDGDHGDNLAMGFRAVEDAIANEAADLRIGPLLRAVGHRLVESVGGASGPLYGTAFIEAGMSAGQRSELGATEVAEALVAAAAALARRGRCVVGDKTILDALGPAAEVFAVAVADGADSDAALALAVRAAWRGMRSTRGLVARRGLALRLGPRSVDHLDPGAVSCFLLIRAMVPSAAERRSAAKRSATASVLVRG